MKPILVLTLIATAVTVTPAHAGDGAAARILNALSRAIQAEQAGADGYGDDRLVEAASYENYGPVIFDVRGRWHMRDGNVNRFQPTYDGIYVIPEGRGRGVHYIEIGPNLYQDANSTGTYEIIDRGYAIWRSNDRKNVVIELFRE
ncbi:MAG: hypothetical protein AAGA68_25910 [Pseudomonadota bacterium]